MSQIDYGQQGESAAAAGFADPERRSGASLATAKVPLGEELPLFCEKCGYALHGLPQQLCQACAIRHFHCPECGHHQPINTLRPAFQKILGRARAFLTVWVVFWKINFFGWLLFAWVGAGAGTAYRYEDDPYDQIQRSRGGYNYSASMSRYARYNNEMRTEQLVAFAIAALAFAMIGRMLLLRWRAGWLVGLVLAALVCLAMIGGAYWKRWTWGRMYYEQEVILGHPFGRSFVRAMSMAGMCALIGAAVAWPVWAAMVTLFLPKRTGAALLDWQRKLSNRAAGALARE